MIKETGRRVLGVSSGRKVDKETWWWNEEVQECIQKIVHGDSCLTSSVSLSITIANKKGLRADP